METSKDYHINLFRPRTPFGKANSKLITSIVVVWVVAVFGFHILLKLVEKPVPEQVLVTFEKVWESAAAGNASLEDDRSLVYGLLSVLGKSVSLRAKDKEILRNVLTWKVLAMLPDYRDQIINDTADIQNTREQIKKAISTDELLSGKNMLKMQLLQVSAHYGELLGLAPNGLHAKLLASMLLPAPINSLDNEYRDALPATMKRYLVHNQSFLTDTKFLGFPFHYFYTAVFLLVLFVFMCWLYCKLIIGLHKKYQITEDV